MGETMLVHVIDDDEALRNSLSSLLRSVGYSVRLYGSAQEFTESDRGEDIQCVVLDIRLPGTSGLQLQDYLRQVSADIPVILITGFGDIRMSVTGMKAGAIDFLEKPFRDQDLLDAVGQAINFNRSRRSDGPQLGVLQDRYETLSPREREVFHLVAAGRLNKQIGGELGISEATAKLHRSATMRKMQAGSVAELARMAEILKSRIPIAKTGRL